MNLPQKAKYIDARIKKASLIICHAQNSSRRCYTKMHTQLDPDLVMLYNEVIQNELKGKDWSKNMDASKKSRSEDGLMQTHRDLTFDTYDDRYKPGTLVMVYKWKTGSCTWRASKKNGRGRPALVKVAFKIKFTNPDEIKTFVTVILNGTEHVLPEEELEIIQDVPSKK